MTVFPHNDVKIIYDKEYDERISTELSPFGDLVGINRVFADGIEMQTNERIFVKDSVETFGAPASFCYYHDGEIYAKTETGVTSYRYVLIPRNV